MPKVLVSDKLSETAVQIFRDRGVEVDYLPDLGKDKDKLAAAIAKDLDGGFRQLVGDENLRHVSSSFHGASGHSLADAVSSW